MKNKIKDPFPITDVYHVSNTLVDAATVAVTDMCENLSNSYDTHVDSLEDGPTKIKANKFNSISVGNGADGVYPVWVGVDKNSKVRKIFAETAAGSWTGFDVGGINSWSWNKEDMNDNFFSKDSGGQKRIKLFDMKINSGVIAITDHGGNFWYEHYDTIKGAINEKYFRKKGIFKNNYPIGLYKFDYGNKEKSAKSSFSSSKIHDKETSKNTENKTCIFIEFLSNLLDENHYPTKYIFEDYLENNEDHNGNVKIKVKDKKISSKHLIRKLPKALQILKKQNKILFKENFKEVHEIRKKQFEDFIISIIKDLEPQELELPTFGKKNNKNKVSNNSLMVDTVGLPYVQEMLYKGFQLKLDPILKNTGLYPVKNGSYPCYLHTYPARDSDDDYSFNYYKVVIEGIEGCYLNKNEKGDLVLNKKYEKSPLVQKHIKNKSKSIKLDQVDLRNSENLDILNELSFIEELELYGLKNIKSWDGLSKLKNLKTLKLNFCDVKTEKSINFFKNLYSLKNLEKFIINDGCSISTPGKNFPKNLFLKKLKSFEIDFRKEWKKNLSEKHKTHQGYGDEGLYFLTYHLPQITNFPNFEKFHSLERLNLYNIFDEEDACGYLFSGFGDNFKKLGLQIKKFKKLKSIWIHGLDIKGDLFLQPKKIQDSLEEITNYKKVLVNGKYLTDKYDLSKIKKLELICSVEKYHDTLVFKKDKTEISINYFPSIADKKISKVLKECFKQNLEEISIGTAYQFFRSENMYSDTFAPIEKHIEENKNLKKIIFNFNEEKVSDDYGDMSGSWYDWDSESLSNFVFKNLMKHKNLNVVINHPDLKQKFLKDKNFDKYARLFNLFKLLSEKNETRNRFEIKNYNKQEVINALEKYLLNKVNTIIVIEDNFGWNESKVIQDIEFISKSDIIDGGFGVKFNEGTVHIEPSYDGTEPYLKESKFLYNLMEENLYLYSEKKYLHFSNKTYDDSYEGPLVFVKQNFLTKQKKTIFKKIKHLFYIAYPKYSFDSYDNITYEKFWKDKEIFNFPKSISLKNLETLSISNGRDVKLNKIIKKIDTNKIKQIILHKCVGKERTFPNLPNLETLVINDKHCEKAQVYSNLSKLKNLRNLEFINLFNENDDQSRWNTAEFDFTDINKLHFLKKLKLDNVNPEFLPPLKVLKNLKELDLSFKLITGDMGSDDGKIDSNLEDKDFEFLLSMHQLKKLTIEFPIDHSNIKGPLFLSYLSKDLEELDISLHYEDKEINFAYKIINIITKKFKKLKRLKLKTGRSNNFETSYSNKIVFFRKTGEKWPLYHAGPRPFIFDCKKLLSLKNLEQIEFSQSYRDDMGFKIINPLKIIELKNIKKINIDTKKFSIEDLIKMQKIINGPRDQFLANCKKKDKSIENEYQLSEKDKEKYDSLDRNIRFQSYRDETWSGDDIEEVIKKEKKRKKKNETTN